MSAFFITVYAVIGIYVVLNFKRDLQMFQQNSYRISRYWKWINMSGDINAAWRLVDVACMFLLVAPLLLDLRMAAFIVALVCLARIFLILRSKSKKPLVLTPRVWRLYTVSSTLAIGGGVAVGICTWDQVYGTYTGMAITMGYALAVAVLSWAVVMIAAVILQPVERLIQLRYINDAKRILRSMPGLRVIGITGSYGKTSTKHYLTRILSEKYDVLMTPGSFNTPMGVVRTIREHLQPYNEIFVCEMGAKQPGDIKEICDIVNPQMGIITAVGPMHLESFKTLENVCSTKFELADALPADGFLAVNNDFDSCASRRVGNVCTARYGITNPKGCAYTATDIRYTPEGTKFVVKGPDGLEFPLETRLLGECNVSDILGAVVIALHLDVPVKAIQYGVRSIEQVEHRLSIKRTPGGVTILDDAFNSNPAGSKMAVDVLSHFNDGKRIIVTPGMIELGSQQDELNREFGRHIAGRADIAVIVGKYNRNSIASGIKETGIGETKVHEADTFNDAQALLAGLLAPGDTVLYENDLPDTFK